jgi:hypothetical protein
MFHNLFMLFCYCFMNLLQIKLAKFYFNLWLWFFITMSEAKRRKTFSVQEKIDILPQVVLKENTCCTGCQVMNCRVKIQDYSFKNRKDTKNVTHRL